MPVTRRHVGPFTPPKAAAKAAALRHVNDGEPGITRHVARTGFAYKLPEAKPVRDANTLARIKALVIPPAWTEVWICTDAEGHLQATGRDARGRKQYRYHSGWSRVRDETKYGRAALFGESLPGIRKRVNDDLAKPGLSRERVLATLVRLLELTFIRVGNAEYARTNKSFGLTTLQDRHVEIAGARVVFKFRGKSGKSHEVRLTDRRMAQLIKRCRDVPGQDLFQYLDDDGGRHLIRSTDVNEYLRSISNNDFTAKDFRTWAGTLLAASALLEAHTSGEKFTKAATLRAVQAVAAQLGNTPAVCRKCYIHPAILKSFEDAEMLDRFVKESAARKRKQGLTPEESALLRFLEKSAA
ncbi:MAG: DNA topoisomerase IB [Phycisphaerae bacterium]|nr:DNA topoisomerase IB [Gemmatimonadaceae bacterium]